MSLCEPPPGTTTRAGHSLPLPAGPAAQPSLATQIDKKIDRSDLTPQPLGCLHSGAPARPTPRATLTSCLQFRVARTSALDRPLLCVVVDTEEEFDWKSSFKRTGYSLRSIEVQWRAQEIFDRWHVRPVYLLDHPVLTSPGCEAVFRRFLEDGRCEVGIQLHPWVTPPFDEVLSSRTSFPCNLPRAIHARKLESMDGETTEPADGE